MTIISTADAVISMTENKPPVCQCRESDLAVVLQLGKLPVSPSNTCQAGGKGTNRIAQDN